MSISSFSGGHAAHGNGNERLDVSAGQAVTVRKGVAHAWCNLSTVPVSMLIIFSPGHIEELFRHVANRKSDDPATIAASAERFGTSLVGPVLAKGIYSITSPRPLSGSEATLMT
jgi:hypothetical protein